METKKYPITIINESWKLICIYKHINTIALNIKEILVDKNTLTQIQNDSIEKVEKLLKKLYEQ
jgi:hypothetical protein